MGHYVYKYVLGDEVIYIGKNDTDLVSRINSHNYDSLDARAQGDLQQAKIYYIELVNSNLFMQIALHVIVLTNSYFLLSGEKYYNENVGAE